MTDTNVPVNDDENERTGLLGSRDDDNEEQREQREQLEQREPRLTTKFCRGLLFILLLIFVCVSVVLVVHHYNHPPRTPPFFNGTHYFDSTIVLVSFDGFRDEYLDRELTPNLKALSEKGVIAEYMRPSFPSVTFANHYTIVTGLHPESHGIVGNDFYDTKLNDTFYYKDPKRSWDSKWWGGEPIWVTAEMQKQRTAMIQWVGSFAVIKGIQPTYMYPFSNNRTIESLFNLTLEMLDKEYDDRPSLIGVYANNVDKTGHRYGPNTTEVNSTLALVDAAFANFVGGLKARNLTDVINVIVVSDHGMAKVHNKTEKGLIFLDEHMDTNVLSTFSQLIHPLEGFPLAGIRPLNDSIIPVLYEALKQGEVGQPYTCYKREEVPIKFHYRALKTRICPIICIPEVGYALTTRMDWDGFYPVGMHGYDNFAPEMRAIFLADGPAFKHMMVREETRVVKPFQNIEVYNVLADILNLTPAANNGTTGGILNAHMQSVGRGGN